MLADEVLTPDSSRFWDAADVAARNGVASFDKQFVRDWLTRESGWDKASDTEPPALPAHVVAATRSKYAEAFERLTGRASTDPIRRSTPNPSVELYPTIELVEANWRSSV